MIDSSSETTGDPTIFSYPIRVDYPKDAVPKPRFLSQTAGEHHDVWFLADDDHIPQVSPM
jgi:hypothetical protein